MKKKKISKDSINFIFNNNSLVLFIQNILKKIKTYLIQNPEIPTN